ncbi:Molybdopterin molybdenumtransferase [Streptomyces hundungensis]|uniref:Molybdopterin molybdenumtransferase n=1 Tax=Streptomyces hundungensis TaxID=1077946 RepID=A0A387HLV8_9ACTN|nr:molybdopterin molybdotransferase MoeA [Streptomyces hundungensis]AYG81800.1 Molybdopterin molybdenumtransferase [Streptomyces hundungensis]
MTAESTGADDGSDEALALLREARPAAASDREARPAAARERDARPTGEGHTGASPSAARKAPRPRAAAWADARAIAARAGRAAPARSHRVPLERALGEILTEPLTALTDLPSFDTSAMDGWAVAGPGPWTVQDGGILAGHAASGALADGEAVRIATGARIPAGATAVIRSEHARSDEARTQLQADRVVLHGQDIRPRGQECRSGDVLLPATALVTPAVLGLAAAAGYDELDTVPRPRVEVLVLGDELLTQGLPHDGLIRDALGPMLGVWLRALGADVIGTRRLKDDAGALLAAVTGSPADVVITTGGTASGPLDHVHPVLHSAGAELLVDGVAVRPGHPMLLAGIGVGKHLVGLPGNPLAAVSGLLTLAEPLLCELARRPRPAPYTAPLRNEVQGHPHDTRLVPVVHRAERVVPLHYNGPAMLRGIAAADGLAVVAPGGARAGQEVEILDLPWVEAGSGQGCFT